MASLLSKFRIDYSDLTIFSDLTKKCQEETMAFYENLVKDFVTNSKADATDAGESNVDEDSNRSPVAYFCEQCYSIILEITISESDLSTMQDKTNRHLRLRELLLENSQDANLIVM
jgi:solute carrier family 12 sodium/potassium/chloride transporter 2